ncbi:hypothetical protein [Adhaeribacter soli]|uniref:Uncharacterized protein n=1 Tax=Adhaeribacter soli TaxID=2607655 RepID=A0A5N1J1S3_9BACT|nr:hypothetical protein [Adhaeribacter soli]KAA9339029.1 hypothetical protein F0P94_09580 [Adhaeribacter soli]
MLLNKLTVTRNPAAIPDEQTSAHYLAAINESLQHLSYRFEKELTDKQLQLEAKDKEIKRLQASFRQKALQISELHTEIENLKHNNEGHRQLNTKLLDDLSRKQQEIEWYKRTYESRSLLGTLKEKIFGKGH